MAYNDLTDRSNPGGGALVPPEHANAIIKEATQGSAALGLMRRVPILTSSKSFPVLSGLPMSFWLDPAATPVRNDTALFQTTEMQWKNVNMYVADLGVIAPVPRRLIGDVAAAGINVTEEIRPALAQATAVAIDQAIFFGTNKPTLWPSDIVTAATAAGNSKNIGGNAAADGGLHADLIETMRTVRADGFRINAAIARGTFEFDLMNARDTTGQPLMVQPTGALGTNMANVLGIPTVFETDGVFPAEGLSAPQFVGFDRTKHLIGIREDMRITLHTEGVIQDATNAIVYNLMQQDIVAVKLSISVGFAVANPVTQAQATEASRYPGCVLKNAAV